jgi:hypothetical protein
MSDPSIQVSILGGLGNQLFQILAMLEISNSQNIPYYISNEDKESSSIFKNRSTYWDTIFKKLTFTKKENIPKPLCEIREGNSNIFINFDPIICPTILQGYFQCSKYFSKDTFKKFITYTNDETDEIWGHLQQQKTSKQSKNIFIHVRRGDYMLLQHFHIVLTIEWYKKALQNFSEDYTFFIFSEDIEWCKQNFEFLKNKFYISDKDYNELFLMGKCDGGIISASSFSWFGAYIASLDNPDCKIICPDIWFKDYIKQRGFRNNVEWITEPVV